jgi:hypothetical protein
MEDTPVVHTVNTGRWIFAVQLMILIFKSIIKLNIKLIIKLNIKLIIKSSIKIEYNIDTILAYIPLIEGEGTKKSGVECDMIEKNGIEHGMIVYHRIQ